MFLTDRFFLKKYVKKFLSFFQLAILFSGGSRPSDGVGGGPPPQIFFLALRASVWSKNKRGAGWGTPLDLSLLFTYNSVLDL